MAHRKLRVKDERVLQSAEWNEGERERDLLKKVFVHFKLKINI